jgi:uncharacterized hydrophobic protein (TIGR00271 family)
MSGLRLVTISIPVGECIRVSSQVDRNLKLAKQSSKPNDSKHKRHVRSGSVIVGNTKRKDTALDVRSASNLKDAPEGLKTSLPTDSLGVAQDVYDSLLKNEYVFDPSWTEGRTHHIMVFRARSKEVRIILKSLNSFGIGLHFGRIDLSELTATIPAIKHPKQPKKLGNAKGSACCLKRFSCFNTTFDTKSYSTSDRMTLQEIHGIVDGQTHLTCEYLTLVFVAALIASIGLRRNSATTVIASMLVSPLMGPILGITFGCAVKDMQMICTSIRNEIVGIVICLSVGILVALIEIHLFAQHIPQLQSMMVPGTSGQNLEMLGRSTSQDLSWGLFVAMPSGIGVALAISSGGINALVGVAISAALLPPICNAGMLFAYAMDSELDDDFGRGFWSLGLFFMNLVVILVVGFITFKIKGINPPENRKDFWRQQSKELETHLLQADAMQSHTPPQEDRKVPSFSVMAPVEESANEKQIKNRMKNANSWAT